MPLDVTLEVSNSTSLTDRGATCICSRCRCIRPDGRDDDCTGDEPDEPVGDRLVMWLCDDDGGQKQFGLAASSGDAVWSALIVDPAARLPSDESSPPALSLNSLHVRLQI
jgi:hypothetical protein